MGVYSLSKAERKMVCYNMMEKKRTLSYWGIGSRELGYYFNFLPIFYTISKPLSRAPRKTLELEGIMDKKKDGKREKAGQGSNPDLKRFIEKIERIKEPPKLPINNLFIAAQYIGEKNTIKFRKGKKRFCVSFGGYKPKTAREKALFLSVYYALIYYAVKEKEGIYITDLMDNIGCHRKPGHGYIQPQKEEVLDMVWNVARSEIGVSGDAVPQEIKELFPDIDKKDNFKINIFSIDIIKQYSVDMRLKDAIVYFKPNFDKSLIIFNRDSEILKLGLHEPEYKNLVIYISYGSNLKNAKKITKSVRDLLKIARIDINNVNPERTYDRLVGILRRAQNDGYIHKWGWERYPEEKDQGKPWLNLWLDTNTILILPEACKV